MEYTLEEVIKDMQDYLHKVINTSFPEAQEQMGGAEDTEVEAYIKGLEKVYFDLDDKLEHIKVTNNIWVA